MAKIITKENIEEIFKVFACKDEVLPSDSLFKNLAKASGETEVNLIENFIDIYKEINETDIDPFTPHMGYRA